MTSATAIHRTLQAEQDKGATKHMKMRAYELFQSHLRNVYEKTDRMFAVLLAAEWVVGIVFACLISPRTWAGRDSGIHPHVLAAIFLGGLLDSLPIGTAQGRLVTRKRNQATT